MSRHRSQFEPVVITGIGLTASVGDDRESVWRAVRQGRSAMRWLTGLPGIPDGLLIGAPVDIAVSEPNELKVFSLFDRVADEAIADAGIRKNAHIHTLRHSYATHLLEQGVSLKIIQEYLGHANIQTTLIYVHLTTKSHDQAYAKIEDLMSDL